MEWTIGSLSTSSERGGNAPYLKKRRGNVIVHFAPSGQIAFRLQFCFDALGVYFLWWIFDQYRFEEVATAPCTDPIQVRFPALKQSWVRILKTTNGSWWKVQMDSTSTVYDRRECHQRQLVDCSDSIYSPLLKNESEKSTN